MADGAFVRPTPHNLEAEQALLGAIFIDNEAADRLAGVLDPVHFYDPVHAEIYTTMLGMVAERQRVTPITMRSFVEDWPPVGEITAFQYLGRLAGNATNIINVDGYARSIVDLSIRRRLIEIGQEMIHRASTAKLSEPPTSQVADAEDALMRLANSASDQQFTFAETVKRTLDAFSDAYQRGGGLAGLSTGYQALDARLGGMGPGDMIVVAGGTSMGKSALAINIAENIASGDGDEWVGVFSQEMSDIQIGQRVFARNSGIPGNRLRTATVSEDEFRTVAGGAKGLAETRLLIDVTGGLTLAKLAAKARRMARTRKIGLLVIDYLQLMTGQGDNQNLKIGGISTGLKSLAKELKIPIMLLSQLSREHAKRENKRPQNSDLRDSGQIEQDADAIMFVHRPEEFLKKEEPPEQEAEKYMKWQTELMAAQGMAEIIFGKVRHGETGIVVMKYDGPTMTFSDEK